MSMVSIFWQGQKYNITGFDTVLSMMANKLRYFWVILFAKTAQLAIKYKHGRESKYARKADEEGHAGVAKLFRATPHNFPQFPPTHTQKGAYLRQTPPSNQ